MPLVLAFRLPGELPANPKFPLSSVKSRVGRGAVGAHKIRHQRDLDFFLDYVDRPVIQEYLASPEYTIDVLCDTRGRAVSIVPRERVVIRAGVIDRGRTVKTSALIRRLAADQCGACRRTHPSHRPAERGEPRALKARSLKPS